MEANRCTIYLLRVILLATALVINGACVKQLDGMDENGEEYISFIGKVSKASPLTQLSGSAGVVAYIYEDWPDTEEGVRELTPWSLLEKKEFDFDGDRLSSASHDLVKWSSARSEGPKLKVFSYAPYELDVTYDGTLPQIHYECKSSHNDHIDIITAISSEISTEISTGFNQRIPLTFNHALTGIKFRSGFDEEIIVKSVSINNVLSKGVYTIGSGWSNQETAASFELDFGSGKKVSARGMISSDDEVLFLIPQDFINNQDARISLHCIVDGTEKIISTPLKGKRWEEGKMITYNLYEDDNTQVKIIYFDLAAGNVSISPSGYSGSVYKKGELLNISGSHSDDNVYYVYQSSELEDEFNHNNTGFLTDEDYADNICTIPDYGEVILSDGTRWADFITRQTSVEKVIESWDDGKFIRDDGSDAPNEELIGIHVARDAGRDHTLNYIHVSGQGEKASFNLTIDNIYSALQERVKSDRKFRERNVGGISYTPKGNTELNINLVGDNRMGNLHINNKPSDIITIEGSGSLTVADTDFMTVESATAFSSDYGSKTGYIGNFWNSAIGNNTHDTLGEDVFNLYFKSGIIFAGTTAAEDATAIGGGGNGDGNVFITGGTITAVATTAGTAIGGGMGHTAAGGPGYVNISGGNVYAYNFATTWGIASSAIGGGGSASELGSFGEVHISGGNIYAYSGLGTAIGGGSSKSKSGGGAKVHISGGNIIAQSGAGNGIGGGSGGSNAYSNGGSAEINISGSPIIRTGSIGSGSTESTVGGKIGTANIKISGGDIQAQFVLAKGSGTPPTFEMTGGTIRNSDTNDSDYPHLLPDGGAVYLQEGRFTMTGGTIKDCSAGYGGAIYIMGDINTTFNMSGGTISGCTAEHDGGAVYLKGGSVEISGGEISSNLANGGNGGAVYITGGNFSMPAGGNATISYNAAFSADSDVDNTLRGEGGSGGGIFVTSETNEVYVNIYSGSISNNSSDKMGGGISVDMEGHDEVAAKVTVGEAGSNSKTVPFISDNHTILMGGGLFARGSKAEITINGGYIKGNTISGYEANHDIANERGTVSLNGGDVETVTIYYYDNFEFYGEESSKPATQLVVKATNSLMHVPQEAKYTKLGYEFTGWNTRPDGKGRDYDENDREKNLMNLSEELFLYAQWRRK